MDTRALVKHFFGEEISDLQAELIKKIVFHEELGIKRLSVCAMTRWGKTHCVARGIALTFLLKPNKRAFFIGPQQEQARILRDYMADLILKCPELLSIAELEVTGAEKIAKEASRSRMTFSTGSEYRVFSAEGDATRLMGHGLGSSGGILVKDEATMITREANTKISRMKGDSPDNVLEIELFNPWDRDNLAFEHYNSGDWETFHVGWKDALKDGRTSENFINEQKRELLPLEFTVLYESEFPTESEDSLFSLKAINSSKSLTFDFENELKALEPILREPHKQTEKVYNDALKESKRYTRIVSCDPADKGLDSTVIYWGVQKDNQFQLVGVYSEPKSESMQIVGKIIDKAENFIGKLVRGKIIIDRIGLGVGPLSRIKEVLNEKQIRNIEVIGAHFGETAEHKDHYLNKKAENYFRLQAMLNDDMIKIIDNKDLNKQLLAMKHGLSSSNKRKIIDPENYSPDFVDALVYFIWKEGGELAFGFL